jgi:hypothetical protein
VTGESSPVSSGTESDSSCKKANPSDTTFEKEG